MKICSKCKLEKKLDNFQKDKTKPFGLRPDCKQCCSKRRKIYYENNKDKVKIYQLKNKNKISLRRIIYYLENKDWFNNNHKEYYQKNKFTINKKQVQYVLRKSKINIAFKLERILRSRVLHAIKGNEKSNKTLNLIGCTIKELKVYLEKQFKPGMSWDNHGYYGWHIDHIKPCASFDLSKPEEQKKCFHYTNLQPLWAEENRKKFDKIIN